MVDYKKENCMTCKFWEPCQWGENPETKKYSIPEMGCCHRHAPHASMEMVPLDYPDNKWVEVIWPHFYSPIDYKGDFVEDNNSAWCGDWEQGRTMDEWIEYNEKDFLHAVK